MRIAGGARLGWSLWLWRDLDNRVWAPRSLDGRTPAMAMSLSDQIWSVLEYVRYPVPVDDLTRGIWAEEREDVLTSALDRYQARRTVPSS